MLQALFVFILSAISICVLYFIIKMAVKNGIIEAHEKMNGRNVQKNSATDNRYPIFGDDSNKSELQKKIESEAFALYAKKKLPIDYSATIERQREEVREYVVNKIMERGKEN